MIRVSMLLPARGRPLSLASSVASVFERAKHPDEVEVLVRLDDDDLLLDHQLRLLQKYPRRQVVIYRGARLGYSRMHDYYNGLAERAAPESDWLFLWNDDIEMVTQDWDVLLKESPVFAVQFPRRDITGTTDYTLPVVGRPVYRALGHLSRNAFCDAWISDFSAFAGTSVIRDDLVFVHHRLQDDTLAGQQDGGREWHRFTTDEQLKMRRADMEAVMAAPGWEARFADWDVLPVTHIGVDYIRLAAGERQAGAVKLLGRR